MSDLSDIMAKADAINATAAAPPPAPVQPPSDLTRALTAGAMDFRSGINNLGSGISAYTGIGDAQALSDEAQRGAVAAEAMAPERIKTTSDDVNGLADAWNKGQTLRSIGDTVRNAPMDLARAIPGMAAPVLAGLGTAALTGNPLLGIAAGSMAGAPQLAGESLARARANPDNTDSPGMQLLKAGGAGLAQSTLMNIVPGMAEGHLMAPMLEKTVAQAGQRSLAADVANSLARVGGGQAAAGAASEAVGQAAAGEQMDPSKMLDAGVGGVVQSLPFAAMHLAGSRMAAARAGSVEAGGPTVTPGPVPVMPAGVDLPPSMRPAEPDLSTPAGRKAAKDAAAAAPAAPDMPPPPEGRDTVAEMDKATSGKSMAQRIADGEPIVDNLAEFASATGQKAMDMFNQGREKVGQYIRDTAAKVAARQDLTPEQRDIVTKAAARPGDEGLQKQYADVENQLSSKDAANEKMFAVEKDLPPEPQPDPGSKQSASTASVDARVSNILAPYTADQSPDTRARMAAVTRRFVEAAGKGEMNEPALSRAMELIGPRAHEAYARIYDAVAPRDAVNDARFARNMQRAQAAQSRDMSVKKVVANSLPEGHTHDVNALTDSLLGWARGESRGGPDMRGAAYHMAMRQKIMDVFGVKGEGVLKALEQYANREADRPGSERGVKGEEKPTTEHFEPADDTTKDYTGDIQGEHGEAPNEDSAAPVYYGAGSSPLTSNELMPSPAAHRAQFGPTTPNMEASPAHGGRAEKLIAQLKKGNPNREVRFISERELNARNGVADEGSEHRGKVVIEEAAQHELFSERDINAVRLDQGGKDASGKVVKNYGNSPSRINVTDTIPAEKDSEGREIKAREPGLTVDATKLSRLFMRNQPRGTGETSLIRTGKAYMDGLVALAEKYPEFDMNQVPDSVVIDRTGNTFGDFKRAMREANSLESKVTPNTKEQLGELAKEWKDVKQRYADVPEGGKLAKERDDLMKDLQSRAKDLYATDEAYADAVAAKDWELGNDRENALVRRKNKGRDIEKGKQADGSPIYDLAAQSASALFDQEGFAKASTLLNQFGDVHGGIDTGKVQERDREGYKNRVLERGATPKERAAIAAMDKRNEQRTQPDARTGKNPTKEFDSGGSGRTDVAMDENIHVAAGVKGDKLTRDANMTNTGSNFDETLPDYSGRAWTSPDEGKSMMNYTRKMAGDGTALGRKIGKRMETLVRNADSMAEKDVRRLKGLMNTGASAEEAATLVNELGRKYTSTIVDRMKAESGELAAQGTKGDSSGPMTKPVSTRPVPPEPEMTKKGNKPLEGYNKGKPTEMLGAPLGSKTGTLINPVERIKTALLGKKVKENVEAKPTLSSHIETALNNGVQPDVPNTPAGRKAVRDFVKSSKDYTVSYEDGKPVFTRAGGGELKQSLGKLRDQKAMLENEDHTGQAAGVLHDMYNAGASQDEILAKAKSMMSDVVTEARKAGTREAMDEAFATAHSIRGMAEQISNQIDNAPLNKAVKGVLESGGRLGDAMDAFIQHGSDSEKIIAQAIKKVAPDVPLTVSDRSATNDMGAYHPGKNSIDIHDGSINRSAGTVLHEGVHAATVAGLSNNPALMEAAHTLLKHVIEHDESFAHRYAATNSLEFIAETLSNPMHQEALRRIPASAEVRGVLGNVKNMWDAFTNLVGKALGIKDKDQNALAQFLDISGAAMKETYGAMPNGSLQRLYEMKLPSVKAEVNRLYDSLGVRLNENGKKFLDYFKENVGGNPTYAHLLTLEQQMEDPADVARMTSRWNKLPYSDQLAGELVNLNDKAVEQVSGTAGATALPSKLEEPPSPKERAAQEAALDKAVTSSDPKLIHELATTDDVHGLQRTVDYLADNHPDSAAMKAANVRMSELSLDDNTAYSATLESKRNAGTANASGVVDAPTRAAIRDHINDVLGPKVLTAFRAIFHEGDFTPLAKTPRGIHDLIQISVHSLDPMSTAYHESMHAFVAQLRRMGLHEMVNVLQEAADSQFVRKQMEGLLGHDSAIMRQLRGTDPEERVAYMYQLWANGQLELDTKPRNVVQRIADMFRKVLGIWSNDERANHIMEYFNSGEYAREMNNRDAVVANAQDAGKKAWIERMKSITAPLTTMSDTMLAAGAQRIRDTANPALTRITDLVKPRVGDTKSGDVGYIPASRLMKVKYMNQVSEVLGPLNKAQLAETLENLQTGVPLGSAESKRAATDIRKFMRDMHNYLTTAGVEIGDLNADYFPRVWDTHYISKNQHAFRGMLDKYVQRGDMTDPQADAFMYKLMRNDGNEFDVNTFRPGMQANKERVYAFIEHEDAARFQSKEIYSTINDYVSQATRRAEWTRRFQGADDIGTLLANARKTGATDNDIRMTEKYIQGITGVLGDSMNPTTRRLQGNMMVYQNIRLLPLAIFSSIIDPQGIMVRGGTVGEAWKAFTYGIKEIPNNLRGIPKNDVRADLAQLMGTIDNSVLTHTLGEAYQQGMVGEVGRKINDTFFKLNLMEGWNRSMRIAATHAAVAFIDKHIDGTNSVHSARWMDELGLKPADVMRKADGSIKLSERDGLTEPQATRMRLAINNWVDGAILRPDAADKPIWANDPRFALIAHLKQFTYSFQHTIIDRVVHEAKEGNYAPAMALASYVPVMIAADALKGLLVTGGVPDRKKKWDALDYTWDGIQRAGLLGVGQYRHDMIQNLKKGGTGFGALEGPTLDQLSEVVQGMHGKKSWKSVFYDGLPANRVFNSK